MSLELCQQAAIDHHVLCLGIFEWEKISSRTHDNIDLETRTIFPSQPVVLTPQRRLLRACAEDV